MFLRKNNGFARQKNGENVGLWNRKCLKLCIFAAKYRRYDRKENRMAFATYGITHGMWWSADGKEAGGD